jgi:hypothetical protein
MGKGNRQRRWEGYIRQIERHCDRLIGDFFNALVLVHFDWVDIEIL